MPKIDRRSDRPPYRQIADNLREAILSGALPPAAKLPSERDLAHDYGVERATAHRAVQELHLAGLVASQQGRGVFVRTRPPVRRISRNRLTRRDQRGFYGDLEDAGLQANVTTTITHRPPPDSIAVLLGVEAGTPVLVRDRHMGTADGPALQLAATYFPPAVFERVPQLAQDNTGPGGMYSRLEDAGYELAQEDIVSSRMPLPEETTALDVDAGVPILTILRITTDASTGDTLEVTDVRLAADRNELRYPI